MPWQPGISVLPAPKSAYPGREDLTDPLRRLPGGNDHRQTRARHPRFSRLDHRARRRRTRRRLQQRPPLRDARIRRLTPRADPRPGPRSRTVEPSRCPARTDGQGIHVPSTPPRPHEHDRLAAARVRAAWKVLRDGLEQTIRRGPERPALSAASAGLDRRTSQVMAPHDLARHSDG